MFQQATFAGAPGAPAAHRPAGAAVRSERELLKTTQNRSKPVLFWALPDIYGVRLCRGAAPRSSGRVATRLRRRRRRQGAAHGRVSRTAGGLLSRFTHTLYTLYTNSWLCGFLPSTSRLAAAARLAHASRHAIDRGTGMHSI